MADEIINEEVVEETPAEEVVEAPVETPNKAEERIKELSGKVKLTSQERDELAEANKDIGVERDFYKDFSETSTKFPQASEHKDAILEKVKSGYSVEDATVSVLNSEGKLIPQKEDREVVAGGSATTVTPEGGKKPEDMTRDEMKEALKDISMDDVKKLKI